MNPSRASFKHRIVLLVFLALGAITMLAIGAGVEIANKVVQGRKSELVAAVDSAQSIVAGYAAKAKAGQLPLAQAQAQAIEALRIARYGNNDYFHVWTMDGKSVMHPFKPEWEGQDMRGKVVDANGQDLVAALTGGLRGSTSGAAFVRTSNHFGPIAPYCLLAAEQGFATVIGSNATTTIAPWGGSDARLGNSPIGFGVPHPQGDPFLLDMATSTTASNKVKVYDLQGKPVSWLPMRAAGGRR